MGKVRYDFTERAREEVRKWQKETRDRFVFDLSHPRLKISSVQPTALEDKVVIEIDLDDSTPEKTMENYRSHMINTLRQATWIDLGNNLIQCPVCFLAILKTSRFAHEIWHERGNYL